MFFSPVSLPSLLFNTSVSKCVSQSFFVPFHEKPRQPIHFYLFIFITTFYSFGGFLARQELVNTTKHQIFFRCLFFVTFFFVLLHKEFIPSPCSIFTFTFKLTFFLSFKLPQLKQSLLFSPHSFPPPYSNISRRRENKTNVTVSSIYTYL